MTNLKSRFILLSLIFMIVLFAKDYQNNDVLILKKGVRYVGKFLGNKSGKVNFRPINSFQFKSPLLEEIKLLKYNGHIIIKDGHCFLHKNLFNTGNKINQKRNCNLK